ncbi:MAG: diheme cytochrome c [Burkholderiaceae bacterium]
MRIDRRHRSFVVRLRGAALLLGCSTLAAGALADGKHGAPVDPAYVAECGACHLPYPPRLLSAASWGRVMQGLERHFGTDASVDPPARERIERYLREHAGPERKFGASALRISETPWFRRKHDEVPAAVWRSTAVKSAANCGACHLAADRGDYGERSVRVPRP